MDASYLKPLVFLTPELPTDRSHDGTGRKEGFVLGEYRLNPSFVPWGNPQSHELKWIYLVIAAKSRWRGYRRLFDSNRASSRPFLSYSSNVSPTIAYVAVASMAC